MNKKLSLKAKTVIVVLIVAIVLASVSIIISYKVYADTMDSHYAMLTMNIAKTAASQMDGDKVGEYSEKIRAIQTEHGYGDTPEYYALFSEVTEDESYDGMLEILFEIKESNDVLYMYVEYIPEKGDVVTYIMDADDTADACPCGYYAPVAAENYERMSNLEEGAPAFITDTEGYGWLCSAGAPIFDSQGNVSALAFVDISMNDVMEDREQFLFIVCLALAIATFVLTALLILLIDRSVVKPINTLAGAAGAFVSERNDSGERETGPSAIARLDIRTGDEIQNLSESIKTMEQDINEYIVNLTAVTAEKERIGAELDVARTIQSSMLPCIFPAFPDRPEFDIYATMTPAKEVGGDFYDFFLIDDDHLAVVIADVSGKGVPAALFMMITKTLVKNQAQSGLQPSEVFTSSNAQLCEGNEAGMFVTAWMGVLEISTGKVTFVNAGHNPPLIRRGGGDFEYLKSRAGFVLAGMEGMKYRQFEFQLEPGDELYLYTDGVTEATDAGNNLYGEERLKAVVDANAELSPMELLPVIKADIDAFVKEAPQFDDITMLALKLCGAAGRREKKVLEVAAEVERLDEVFDFLGGELEAHGCPQKARIQIETAVEELFVNIAKYAYGDGEGKAVIEVETDEGGTLIRFIDSGVPYDPLAKPDPDITLSAEERNIGGLGIYMVKKSMNRVEYEYTDGKNILTIEKRFA